MSVFSPLRGAPSIRFSSTAKTGRSLIHAGESVGWDAAEVVSTEGVCHIAVGHLGLSAQGSAAVADAVLRSLSAHAELTCSVRFDVAWKRPHVVVPVNSTASRLLLPHHDGGSVTRLETPATATRMPDQRRKAFATFLVADPGQGGAGVTTFFPLVPLVALACGGTRLNEALAWYGETQQGLWAARAALGLAQGYLTVPMMLGAASLGAIRIDRSEGHQPLSPEERAALGLGSSRPKCPCGTCDGDVARIYCAGLYEASGLTLPRLHTEFGLAIVAKKGDLVVWNNVFMQHGAVGGGAGRTLTHGYLVSHPTVDYLGWLESFWKRQWGQRVE